ncbi:MAG: glycosyltransferase family 4 protein [Gemmatimonadaceae bacterium]
MSSTLMERPTPSRPSRAVTRHDAPHQRWCVVTCEYPPLEGGVSDHTRHLVAALAAQGDLVDVWCPPAPTLDDAEPALAPEIAGVTVHVLPSRFGLRAISLLRRELRALPPDTRVLVQWVPTAFGWRMMNLPFALMLFRLPGRRLDLVVHEVGWDVGRETARRALAGIVHRVMTWCAARSARRIYVTIPAWQNRLSLLGARALPRDEEPTWVPVPSNVPDRADERRVAELRRALLTRTHQQRVLVGHFGTFGRFHAALMPHVVARILDEAHDRTFVLVGRGGEALRDYVAKERPELAARIVATGGLAADEVAAHLAACDLLVQPFEDGASTRRGSLMAGVALGRPTIANRGRSTEELWSAERAIHLTDSHAPHAFAGAVTKLLADANLRQRLAENARRLYAERFAMAHVVAALRTEQAVVESPA